MIAELNNWLREIIRNGNVVDFVEEVFGESEPDDSTVRSVRIYTRDH